MVWRIERDAAFRIRTLASAIEALFTVELDDQAWRLVDQLAGAVLKLQRAAPKKPPVGGSGGGEQ